MNNKESSFIKLCIPKAGPGEGRERRIPITLIIRVTHGVTTSHSLAAERLGETHETKTPINKAYKH
jgi:hypothetical protein